MTVAVNTYIYGKLYLHSETHGKTTELMFNRVHAQQFLQKWGFLTNFEELGILVSHTEQSLAI